MASKVNSIHRDKPKVHYTDIIDPEHFAKVTAPAIFRAMEEVEQKKSQAG